MVVGGAATDDDAAGPSQTLNGWDDPVDGWNFSPRTTHTATTTMEKQRGTRNLMDPALSLKSITVAKEAVAPSHPRPRTVAVVVTKATIATTATGAPAPEAGAPRLGEEEVEGGRTIIIMEEEVALRKGTPTGGRTKTRVNTTITVSGDGRVMGEVEILKLQLPLSVRRMAGSTSELPRTATALKAPPEAHQAVRTPKPGIRGPGHRHSSSQLGRQVLFFEPFRSLQPPSSPLVSVSYVGRF